MIRHLSKIVVLLTVLSAFGQSTGDHQCGTHATQQQIEYMNSMGIGLQNDQTARISRNSTLVRVPVKFFIIRNSDNSGGLSTSRISTLLSEVNSIYASANMVFFEAEEATIIANDNYYNLDSSQEDELAGPRDLTGVINIYVSGNLTSGSSQLCGYTRFPPSTDRVFLAMGCADNEVGTTAHELGHYFTLYHTHGKTNNGTTDELVTRGPGANCTTAGDDICDTSADPNLSGQVGGSCSYTGTATDSNGESFNPDPTNLMSYAPNSCRNTFSPGQFDRIRDGLDLGRNYLNLVFEGFTAKFSTDVRVGCAPVTIEFSDNTNNGVSRTWTFPGSDKETSVLKTVFVTYDEPGFYDVTLTVANSEGQESSITRSNYILVKDPFENVVQSSSVNTFSTSDLPDNWAIDNDDNGTTWEYTAASSDASSGSYFVNNFNYGSELLPQSDELVLSSIDLSDVKSLQIDFDYAYTHRFFEEGVSNKATDDLIFGYRLDCDTDIEVLFQSGGEDLRTTETGRNDFFTPTENEWETLSFTIDKNDIPLFQNFSSLTPVIQNQSGNGNNLYIDQVQITPDFSLDSVEFFRGRFENNTIILRWANPSNNSRSVVIERSINGVDFEELTTIDPSVTEFIDDSFTIETSESIRYRVKNVNNIGESSYSIIVELNPVLTNVPSEADIKVYPNPTSGSITVVTKSDNSFHVIEVMDLSGRIVKKLETNQSETQIDLSTFEGGLFFVRINDGINTTLRKIIKLD